MNASTAAPVKTYPTIEGDLPAQVLDAETLPKATEIEVGQIVAFHSRGRYRAAQVVKVTPKRVTAIYTTEGARKDGEKIGAYNRVASLRGRQSYDLKLAAEYRENAAAVEAGTEAVANWADSAAHNAAQLREWADSMEAANAEDGEQFKTKLAAAEAEDAKPVAQRIVEATHVTTKNVKRDEVFAV